MVRALEAISDPALVASAIVGALGLQDPTGRPARDQLAENLAGRALLLVLDNFEQVMPAIDDARRACSSSAPAVKVIATSRAPCICSAEQVYPVAPLAVPSTIRTAPARPSSTRRPRSLAPSHRCGSSSIASGRSSPVTSSGQTTRPRSSRSASGSTACRLASSWPPLASRSWVTAGVAERLARQSQPASRSVAGRAARQRTLARDDRLEPRPAGPARSCTVRSPVGLRRRLAARGGRSRLRPSRRTRWRGPRHAGRARRPEPRDRARASRGDAIRDAGDDPAVRRRTARRRDDRPDGATAPRAHLPVPGGGLGADQSGVDDAP